MHHLTLVFGPDVEGQMAPHRETYDENDERTGFWDWYAEGGRWDSYLELRDGTTSHCAQVAEVAWEKMRRDDGTLYNPYTIVRDGVAIHCEEWTGDDFVADPDWDARWIGLLETIPRDERVTVVDYHS